MIRLIQPSPRTPHQPAPTPPRSPLHGRALLMLSLLTLLLLVPAVPAAAGRPADVVLVLLPVPNVSVTPGGIITYEIKLQNGGRGEARRVLVEMPYDPQLVEVVDARFEQLGDGVGSAGPDRVRMSFERLQGNGSVRKAYLRMRVRPDVLIGTVINMWAGYGWDGANGGKAGMSSNAAPVLVLNEDLAYPTVWMAVDPAQAPAGTLFQFYTNRLLPGERTVVELIAPYGTSRFDQREVVNARGEFWFKVRSDRLPPGSYTLTVFGLRSNLTAAVNFEVTQE